MLRVGVSGSGKTSLNPQIFVKSSKKEFENRTPKGEIGFAKTRYSHLVAGLIATNGVPKDEHTISYCFATVLICVEPAEGVEDTHIGLAEVTREVEVVV